MVAGKFRRPRFGTSSLADVCTGTSGMAKDKVAKNMFSDHVICLTKILESQCPSMFTVYSYNTEDFWEGVTQHTHTHTQTHTHTRHRHHDNSGRPRQILCSKDRNSCHLSWRTCPAQTSVCSTQAHTHTHIICSKDRRARFITSTCPAQMSLYTHTYKHIGIHIHLCIRLTMYVLLVSKAR
jgi:hypothetical protein